MAERRDMYAVIADDLTGAGDTGVQFARAGLRTRALMGDWSAPSVEGADVIVINTESRALAPEAAYEAVARAAARLRAVEARPIYKKIDSTMRGPVGAEVDAVMDVFDLAMAVVCPAFPDNGRAVVGGHLLVGGQPVARTAIGRDPVAPVRESFLPALLASQSRRPVHHVDLRVVEQGARRLGEHLATLRRDGGCLVTVDAVGDADLETIVEAVKPMGESVLLVGSAGLARPLARQLATARAGAGQPGGPGGRVVLVMVGSVNPVSREQMARLGGSRETEIVSVDVAAAVQDEASWQRIVDRARERVRQAASAGRTVVLTTPGEPADVEAARGAGAARGMEPRQVARRVAEALGTVAVAALDEAPLAGVVVTGGDTAQALLDLLEADGIDLVSEVLPGIPFGVVHGGKRPGLRIVTKAGGFGGPDALVQAATYLAGLP
ncbi:MAG TPA: DUF3253 domain-containing protein [Limnochordales bacterium]